jgi:type IV secretion system protein TrbL
MNFLSNIASAKFTLLDRPLIDGIAYFAGAMQGFFRIASTLALALGVIGIVWTCFRLWFGALQVRKALISLMGNFLLFAVLTACYPRIVNSVLNLSLRIGMAAGNGYFKINSAFLALRNDSVARQKTARETIKKMLQSSGDLALREDDFKKLASSSALNEEDLKKILKDNEVKIYSQEEFTKAGKGGSGLSAWFNNTFFPSKEQEALKMARNNFNKSVKDGVAATLKDKDLAQAMVTMKALDEVLSEVQTEGVDGEKVTKYLYDPFLRNDKGASLGILSPGAMIKTAVLIADIISRQGSYSYDPGKKNFIEQTLDTVKNLPQLIVSVLLKTLMTFGILIAGIFFVLHYCLCIIEYYIVAAAGLLLVPCVLFEGTRDFAKKLVGIFASYFIKIIVMSLAVFWAYSAFISMGNDIIGSNQPISFLSLANFLFTTLLSWVVVREAPKIAQGLLSGSPSLSMGDFIQAAGSAMRGGGAVLGAAEKGRELVFGAQKPPKGLAHYAKGGAAAAGRGITNVIQSIREKNARGGGREGLYGGRPPLYAARVVWGGGGENKAGGASFREKAGTEKDPGERQDGGLQKPFPPAAGTPPSKEAPAAAPPGPLTAAKNSASSRANAESAGKTEARF